MPNDERGICYSEQFDRLKVLPKIEADHDAGLPARFDCELGRFLEETQTSLSACGVHI